MKSVTCETINNWARTKNRPKQKPDKAPPLVPWFCSFVIINLEILVVLVGIALMVVSSCGCVGALRENTCLLNTYSYFITALLLLHLILGLLLFFIPSQLKRLFRATLTEQLVTHYRDSPDLQRLIDSVQVPAPPNCRKR